MITQVWTLYSGVLGKCMPGGVGISQVRSTEAPILYKEYSWRLRCTELSPNCSRITSVENSPSSNEDLNFCALLPQSPATDYNILESAFKNNCTFSAITSKFKKVAMKKRKNIYFQIRNLLLSIQILSKLLDVETAE